jgi:hypothetical protein
VIRAAGRAVPVANAELSARAIMRGVGEVMWDRAGECQRPAG